eukprot:CAMPEP_0118645982 /NCGR_PEP_ID=MMETSP0785-20121206/7799_1 /TAXON_ID=91992 /ORGANISM="Bolidomonas pacifica, Strain CCMP 1866" /LENGTH=671 /DNA_ID=CAMNT_0006537917 /DNA_START=16 /DNA_END=2027 /DNA_ORIENTATION=-
MGNRVKGKTKKKSIKAASSSSMGSTRKLSRMGKKLKAGNAGLTATFISRSSVLKKLQITLKDFRRLCILKGIYPRVPSKSPGSKKGQTFYHIKDVTYLAHEPLLEKFREFKTYMKKVRKAAGRNEKDEAARMNEQTPSYTLHHLVKERYPRFIDALGDLDDCLSLLQLFAKLPGSGKVKSNVVNKCKELCENWNAMVVKNGGVEKVFVSVKGIYCQANIQGVEIRWLVPHSFTQYTPTDVDYRVMSTFVEFYQVMLDFVLYKLFTKDNLAYPRKNRGEGGIKSIIKEVDGGVVEAIEEKGGKGNEERVSNKKSTSNTIVIPSSVTARAADEEDEEEDEDSNEIGLEGVSSAMREMDYAMDAATDSTDELKIFDGLVFYISREVPRSICELVILSNGGKVGWEGEGSTILPNDGDITHFIVDRPKLPESFKGYPKEREYIQPQWIFDCSNFRYLLPVSSYKVGSPLPPHLSPWAEESGYVPRYKKEVDAMIRGEVYVPSDDEEDEVDEAGMEKDVPEAEGTDDDGDSDEEDEDKVRKSVATAEDKEDDLAKIMMSKKAKRLYGRMQHGIKEKQDAVDTLERKRREIEREKKRESKKRKVEIITQKEEEERDEKEKIGLRKQCIGGKGRDDKGRTAAKQKIERLKGERKKLGKQFDNVPGLEKKKKKKKKKAT